MSCVKTADPIEMPFGMLSRVGSRKHVLDGVRISHAEGQFCGGKGRPIVTYRDSVP